jgi:hypothetical protein
MDAPDQLLCCAVYALHQAMWRKHFRPWAGTRRQASQSSCPAPPKSGSSSGGGGAEIRLRLAGVNGNRIHGSRAGADFHAGRWPGGYFCQNRRWICRGSADRQTSASTARGRGPLIRCFQIQNAATTNRAVEITKSDRRSRITVPHPDEGKRTAGWGTDGPCRQISDRGGTGGHFRPAMRDDSRISRTDKAATKLVR